MPAAAAFAAVSAACMTARGARLQSSAIRVDTTAWRPVQVGQLIVDTDVGLDDVASIALLAAARVPVSLITTTCGICQSGTGAMHVTRLADALNMTPTPKIISGAENQRLVAYDDWEHEQHQQLSLLCHSLGADATMSYSQPSVDEAADAILQVARAKERASAAAVTVLALGSMTNLAAAAHKDPATFSLIDRIIFVGGVRTSKAGYHHQPYNAWLDPDALRTVLRSGVRVELIGHACYPKLAWCSEVLNEAVAEGEPLPGHAPCHSHVLQHVFRLDARQMAFDPLAVFYLVAPDAFVPAEPIAVRVTRGAQWRFEECDPTDAPDAEQVVEFNGVCLEQYREWLIQALNS